MVENSSEESCLPCDQAWLIFGKYGLDVVKIQDLGTFTNYGAFCDQMETTFKEVAKSPIAQDEEGNVLYFEDKTNGRVLSLAKLKTLEYRLFRKMREKLRGFYMPEKKGEELNLAAKSKTKFDGIAKKFSNESKEFLEDGKNELPHPLEYYQTVFNGAFEYIQENPSAVHELHNQYVTFSENLLKFIKEKNGGDVALTNFFYSDILDIQKGFTKLTQEEEVKNPEEAPRYVGPPKVIFIVPFAMASSGKSYIWQKMQDCFENQKEY